MDVIIANVYFCNSDWPNNNVKFWRYNIEGNNRDSLYPKDGRWRWMLFDTDWGFGYTGNEDYKVDLLEKASKVGSHGIIFSGLLKNDLFLDTFVKRFDYYLNGPFSPAFVKKNIEQFQSKLQPEMEEHINRWRLIGSVQKWNNNIDVLRDFAEKRNEIQKQQLNKFVQNLKNKK